MDELAELVLAERDKFREHSIALNRVGYAMAEALGQARDGGPVVANVDRQLAALIEQRDRYKLLFTALVAELVGRVPDNHTAGAVKVSWQAVHVARGLELIEWPMVEYSYDFSVKARDPK